MKKLLLVLLLSFTLVLSGCTTTDDSKKDDDNQQPEVNYDDLNDLEKAVYDSLHASSYHIQIFYDLGDPIGELEYHVDVEGTNRYFDGAFLYFTEIDGTLFQIQQEPEGYKAVEAMEFNLPPVHEIELEYLTELIDGTEQLHEEGYYEIDLQGEGFNNGKMWVEDGMITKIEYYAGHTPVQGNILKTTFLFTEYNTVSVTLPKYEQLGVKEGAEYLLKGFGYHKSTENGYVEYSGRGITIIHMENEGWFELDANGTMQYWPETGLIKMGTTDYHVDNFLDELQNTGFPYYLFQLLDRIESE